MYIQAFSFDECDRTRTCQHTRKSYSAEKVLFIEYSSFNPLFMFTSAMHLWIMPKAEDRFCRVSLPKPVLYTILNVKFLPFV